MVLTGTSRSIFSILLKHRIVHRVSFRLAANKSPLLEKGAALDASPVHVVPQIRHERDPTKIPLNPLWTKAGYFRYLPSLLAIKKQETYFLFVGCHGWIEIENPVNGIAVGPFLVLRFHGDEC